MGCSNPIKTIIRIAVPTIVALTPFGQPLAIAIAAAGATAATGGSFKETLISGGTSFIGAHVAQGLSEAVTQAGTQVATDAAALSAASNLEGSLGAAMEAANAAVDANTSWIGQLLAEQAPELALASSQAIAPGLAQGFADITNATTETGLGLFAPGQSGFDVLQGIGNQTFGQLGAKAVGGAFGLSLESTINQALDAGDFEALKSVGFKDEAIKVLSNERKKALLDDVYTKLINAGASQEQAVAGAQDALPEALRATTLDPNDEFRNPFKDDTEFKSVLSTGLNEINKGIGSVTREQFDQLFSDIPAVGNKILTAEESARRDAFVNKLRGGIDPTRAFTPMTDDSAIEKIIAEKQGPAFQQIANIEARGAFNLLGGQTAKQNIEKQKGRAQSRLDEIGSSVLERNKGDVGAIRDEGLTAASNYKLGDELFDEKPFIEKAKSLEDQRLSSLEGDIRSSLGSEELFDVGAASKEAGRTQGVVSGKPSSNALLDVIAARGLTEDARKRRGIGTRGSGVF